MNALITIPFDEYDKLQKELKKIKAENWKLEVNKENIECSQYYAPYYFPHYQFRRKDEVVKELTEEIKKSNKQLEFLVKATPKEFKIWQKNIKGDKNV